MNIDLQEVNGDFIDMLTSLRDNGVSFLVVGAYALAAHGVPRATGHIDILAEPTATNAANVLRALAQFGAPVSAHGVTAKDFEKANAVYQIGLPPCRIDLLTSISGVDFQQANADAKVGHIGPCEVRFIGREALITNKRATGRMKDLADVELLERLKG